MACTRGLHVGPGSGVTPGRNGLLLHGYLLGDLARYETSISSDIPSHVSF